MAQARNRLGQTDDEVMAGWPGGQMPAGWKGGPRTPQGADDPYAMQKKYAGHAQYDPELFGMWRQQHPNDPRAFTGMQGLPQDYANQVYDARGRQLWQQAVVHQANQPNNGQSPMPQGGLSRTTPGIEAGDDPIWRQRGMDLFNRQAAMAQGQPYNGPSYDPRNPTGGPGVGGTPLPPGQTPQNPITGPGSNQGPGNPYGGQWVGQPQGAGGPGWVTPQMRQGLNAIASTPGAADYMRQLQQANRPDPNMMIQGLGQGYGQAQHDIARMNPQQWATMPGQIQSLVGHFQREMGGGPAPGGANYLGPNMMLPQQQIMQGITGMMGQNGMPDPAMLQQMSGGRLKINKNGALIDQTDPNNRVRLTGRQGQRASGKKGNVARYE